MNSLLEQLHDIEGLDPISWWPLPLGWWMVIIVAAAAAGGLLFFGACRIAYRFSWKYDALLKLKALEKNLSEGNARETVMDLSEYLRRIALKKYSRKECAGLLGDEWLTWLAKHDPQGFDWENKGKLFLAMPYAPPALSFPADKVADLIQAVKSWVR